MTRDHLTRLLGGAAILLAALVGMQLLLPAAPRIDARTARAPLLPEDGEAIPYDPPKLADFEMILQRPLFFEDRRLPPEPEAPAPEVVPAEPLRLSLQGVAISNGSRVALLRDQRGNELIQLAEGMSHNGWVLESVDAGTAEFRRGEDLAKLDLEASDNDARPTRRFRR